MTVEQIVDIPASRRLFVEVPREIPAGKTKITFTPVLIEAENAKGAKVPFRLTAREVLDRGLGFGSGLRIDPREALEQACGIAKRLGAKLTSSQSIAWRREDAALEKEQYRRLLSGKEGGTD